MIEFQGCGRFKSKQHFARKFVLTLATSREKIKGYCYEYSVEAMCQILFIFNALEPLNLSLRLIIALYL